MISDSFNMAPAVSERKLLFIDTSGEEKLFIFLIYMVTRIRKIGKSRGPFLKETHWTVRCVSVFVFDLLFYIFFMFDFTVF